METIEVSEDVIEAAKTCFGFQEDKKNKLIIGDGIKLVLESKMEGKYDYILADAYTEGMKMPNKTLSKSFMKKVGSILSEDGVFILHFCTLAYKEQEIVRVFELLVNSFRKVFQIEAVTRHKIIVCSNQEDFVDVTSPILSKRLELISSTCNFPDINRGLGYVHKLSGRSENETITWKKIVTTKLHKDSTQYWCSMKRIPYSNCSLDLNEK